MLTRRYSDWTTTLWAMTLDLLDLAYHATGGVAPRMDKFISALLMPLMVFFGGIYRFYANELRSRKDKDANNIVVCSGQGVLGIVGFVASCVLFYTVVTNIIDPITNEQCPPGATPNSDDKCPITDTNKKNDATAVVVLTLVWIGYPIVAFLSRLFTFSCSRLRDTAYVSVGKDIAYAILDVVSKGGLALYVSYRTTWL